MKIEGESKVIASAFIKARSEMSATVIKDAKGNYGKYMTLAALVEATANAFAKHGLAIVQEAGKDESGVTIDTWLIHESGSSIHFGTLTMPMGDGKPQTVGSALTYGRRYALAAVCGIAGDDDDAQAAQDSYKPRKAQSATPAPQSAATGQDSGSDGDVVFAADGAAPAVGDKPERAKLSDDQLETLQALGRTYYGNAWGKKQKEIAEAASTGIAHRVADLMPKEATLLIAGLQKRINEAEAQAETQVPA